ncbi:MAG: CRISPR-associated endonuclease Cas3'' [Sumerlaeia bacterium]
MTRTRNYFPPDLIARTTDIGLFQTLEAHSVAVGERTGQSLADSLGDEWMELGLLVGLLHDLGKAHPKWQRAIAEGLDCPPHAAHGAYAFPQFGGSMIASFAIAAHHSGLKTRAGLVDLIADRGGVCAEAFREIQKTCSLDQLRDDFAKAQGELRPWMNEKRGEPFSQMLFIRTILSALVDADRLNSEEFAEQAANAVWRREAFAPFDAAAFLKKLEARYESFPASESVMARCRSEILRATTEAASLTPGLFTLTVPTGGGKTLAALNFALRHALAYPEYGFRRIIVVIPYLSIIEQNARVYRELLGDDVVLEHHSSVELVDDDEKSPRERRASNGAENWDAPVVVTTSVQFLETLFAHRATKLRKLHNAGRSIVVFDEVQTLPMDLLAPTVKAIEALRDVMGCSVVLSSATQPALNSRLSGFKGQSFDGLKDVRHIVPEPELPGLFQTMARVDYDFTQATEEVGWEELRARLRGELETHGAALCVMNTKKHVQRVAEGFGEEALLFSAAQCAEHRTAVLAEAKRRLAAGEPVLLFSTQAIEAGVDISFPIAYRAMAPMEGIIQAAGRCNRNGELGNDRRGRVVVFQPPTGDGAWYPRDRAYKNGIEAVRNWLKSAQPDLHDPGVFSQYSRHVIERAFSSAKAGGSYSGLDAKGILKEMTTHLRFPEVADSYRLIDANTMPLIAPYPHGGHDIDGLVRQIRSQGYATRQDFRQFQRYMVSHYKDGEKAQRFLDEWTEEIAEGVRVLMSKAYDCDPAVPWKGAGKVEPEELPFHCA